MNLFPTILLVCGKANFTNLSHYRDWSDRTYRRQYSQPFNFVQFNQGLIEEAIAPTALQLGVMDCSFVQKSGKATYGLDWFYNGSANRTERGLEISVIAVVDVGSRRAYSLSLQQTPAQLSEQHHKPRRQRVSRQSVEQAQQMLQQLPDKGTAMPPEPQRVNWQTIEQLKKRLQQLPDKRTSSAPSRIDHYLLQLRHTRPYLPAAVQYWAVDGFYAKKKFVDGGIALDLAVISKLRVDADMRYLYTGVQKQRGARRKYDGKVVLGNWTRWSHVEQLESEVNLYTALVWHGSLKRQIRLACLVDTHKAGKTGYALLFSSDMNLDAKQILQYYQARFQIEFIFRDAKQFTGLCDAQTRDPKRLDFHFNAALTALNLAKYQDQVQHALSSPTQTVQPFSMASYKRFAFNDYLLEQFICQLDLNPTLIKSHPNYENLRSYGIIAA